MILKTEQKILFRNVDGLGGLHVGVEYEPEMASSYDIWSSTDLKVEVKRTRL